MDESKPESKRPSAELVRSDLNLEKWPVYLPSDSRMKPHARLFEREATLADGRRVAASVKVGFTDLGMLVTDDQKVFCALLKLWEEDGRPSTLQFSLRRLGDALRRKWNGKLAKALTDSLLRLRSTPFVWTNAYEDAVNGELLRLLKTFTILEDLELAERAVHGHTTGQSCRAKFHPLIDANIRHNFSKPILYDTIIGFESGVAQLLYRHLDIVMWSKTRYVVKTKNLFEELGLEGEDYKYVSRRKRTLERAFREIDGAPITSGVVRATLEPTRDGKDLNAVFTKIPGHDNQRPLKLLEAAATNAPELSEDSTLAHEVVRHFYQVFHGHNVKRFNAKELDQAATLVAEYGEEVARHTVDFAHANTSRDFRVQKFGYVLAFADRARADLAAAPTPSPAAMGCEICGDAGYLTVQRTSGEVLTVGCPHDAVKVEQWMRERELRLVDPLENSQSNPTS